MENSILINAEIRFNEAARKWIASWPLIQNFRTSFWLEGGTSTCPCEIRNEGQISEIDKPYNVVIMLPKVEFIKDRLSLGTKFCFGLHSEPIGEGRVR